MRRHLPLLLLFLCALGSPPPAGATTGATLTLDGDGSRLEVENAPDLNPTVGITVEAWVRPTSFAGFPTIVSKSFVRGWWLGLTTSGRVRFYTSGQFSDQDGSRVLPLGEWTHVAVTFDGTTRRYYVDGALDLELATPAPLLVSGDALGIGAEAGGSFPFQGNLAEVRVWSRARTQAEIRTDLVRQMDVLEDPDLAGVWNLDGSSAEAFGRYETSEFGTARFTGLAAPPEPFGPLRIPRLGSAPASDGTCSTGEYGSLRLPLYYDATSAPRWVRVGATQFDLHFCFDGIPRGTTPFASTATVQIDRSNDRGILPDEDDVRFGLEEDGIQIGQEGGGGWSDDPTLASFFDADTDLAAEFDWDAEIDVSRLLLGSAVFGLSFTHRSVEVLGDDADWPLDGYFLSAFSWDPATVDDSAVPRADSENPTIDAFATLGDRVPGTDRFDVTVRGSARDDVDVASIEVYVDGALVEICDVDGSDDRSASCSHSDEYALGVHRYHALAFDHRGRVAGTAVQSFRVSLTGEAPVVTLDWSPERPAPGATVHVTAAASDPEGLGRIRIALSTTPFSHECLPAGATDTTCELDVVLPASRGWFTVQAEARDAEDFVSRTPTRYVISNETTDDFDDDGLPNSIEMAICSRFDLPDTDRDGLLDSWEVLGLATPGGGFVDLPALGAQPCRRDVFLQYDYEEGARVDTGVVADVVAAYRAQGIALHVEENERPRPPSDPLSPLGAVTAAQQKDDSGDYWFLPERNWTHYYAYSRHRVGRSGAWGRYFTFDIYVGRDDCECALATDPALCRIEPGCVRESRNGQTRRFLHELGHMVGLGHGGQIGVGLEVIEPAPVLGDGYPYFLTNWDGPNHKPNHISVMNYRYNGGLYCQRPTSTLSFVSKITYAEADLPELDEDTLDERTTSPFATAIRGLSCDYASDPGAKPVFRYTCIDDRLPALGNDSGARVVMVNDGTRAVARFRQGGPWETIAPGDVPDGIDWNCDGAISSSVAGSVNGDGGDWELPGEACDGMNNDPMQDMTVDEGCGWAGGEELRSVEEWSRIPHPPACLALYSTRDARNCYAQIADYRAGIGVAGTQLDCRVRENPMLEDQTCDPSPVIFDGMYTPLEQDEEDAARDLPGTESCNDTDDDDDAEVDEGCADGDSDGVADVIDNCPATPNADQRDADGNFLGDACQFPGGVEKLALMDGPNGPFLAWDPPFGSEVSGYNVYRENLTTGALVFLGDGQPSTPGTGYTDPSAPDGEQIRYRVVPLDLLGNEVLGSVEVSTPIPEPAATALGLAALGALAALRRRRGSR